MKKDLQRGKRIEQEPLVISDVARLVSVSAHVLRFWEEKFPQVRPSVAKGERRRYSERNIRDLLVIKRLLHEEGFTIKGLQAKVGNGSLVSFIKMYNQQIATLVIGSFDEDEHISPCSDALESLKKLHQKVRKYLDA